MQQTWSIWLKLYVVIMEVLNKKIGLGIQAPQDHRLCGVGVVEVCTMFADLSVGKQGTVTLCVNCLDGSKESCKVKTKKYTLQFTTSDNTLMLKMVLGSTITVSTQNGFPTALKQQMQAADDYQVLVFEADHRGFSVH
jgi:hypothetical protein